MTYLRISRVFKHTGCHFAHGSDIYNYTCCICLLTITSSMRRRILCTIGYVNIDHVSAIISHCCVRMILRALAVLLIKSLMTNSEIAGKKRLTVCACGGVHEFSKNVSIDIEININNT